LKLDRITLVMVALSVAMSVTAQLSLRTGMQGFSDVTGLDLVAGAIRTPAIWAGLALYGFATITWVAVLSRIDLAVAYPLASMNYVFVTLFSWLVLNERVPALRWLGVLSIFLGVLVVARGERPDPRAGGPMP
jgi:drug/metabolite transporter (DMT)-like permease